MQHESSRVYLIIHTNKIVLLTIFSLLNSISSRYKTFTGFYPDMLKCRSSLLMFVNALVYHTHSCSTKPEYFLLLDQKTTSLKHKRSRSIACKDYFH